MGNEKNFKIALIGVHTIEVNAVLQHFSSDEEHKKQKFSLFTKKGSVFLGDVHALILDSVFYRRFVVTQESKLEQNNSVLHAMSVEVICTVTEEDGKKFAEIWTKDGFSIAKHPLCVLWEYFDYETYYE